MRKKIIFTYAFALIGIFAFSQNYSKDAVSFFKKFKTIDAVSSYALQSFPTLDECRYVFKGNAVYTYFAKVTEVKKIAAKEQKATELFGDVKVESFTTEDLISNNAKNTEVAKMIKESFQPNVMFYVISLRKDQNAEAGQDFKYFVYLNGRWVMFPKPMQVLSENDIDKK